MLPTLADEFEIIAVDDGSQGRHAAPSPTAWRPSTRRSASSTTQVNRGYGGGAAQRLRAPRASPLVAFTDGDRQFRSPTSAGCSTRMAQTDKPDVVVGYRDQARRPIHPPGLCARLSLRAARLFGLRSSDPDCACKLFRREALEGIRLESQGGFLSGELLIKLRQRGRTIAEVGVPHYPRMAGQQSGANPKVVLRAIRDFWRLRLRLWANRKAALVSGEPVLGPSDRVCASRAGAPPTGRWFQTALRPRAGRTSSELMNSRKTDRLSSSALSGIDPRAVEHRVRGEDRHARTDGQRDRVARPRVHLQRLAVHFAGTAARGRCRRRGRRRRSGGSSTPSCSSVGREEVVRHRPLRRHALQAHGDGVGLPRPDPDGQVPLANGVAQDHHVLGREHVDADAFDDHLVEARRRHRMDSTQG